MMMYRQLHRIMMEICWFAPYCAVNEWRNFKAEPIDLYEFIEKWLVGMRNNGVNPSIFPTNKDSVMVEIDVILSA